MIGTFTVSACGNQVRQDRETGHVAAVFDHSFYVVTGGAWMCLGTDAMQLGPLNVRPTAPATTVLPASGLRTGDRIIASAGRLHVRGKFVFDFRDATTWSPPPPPRWTAETLARGLAAIARGMIPAEAITALAREPIARLSEILAAAMSADQSLSPDTPRWVSRLVGLGPGLTPSGDDFLGGMMIALGLLDRPALMSQFSTVVLHAAGRNTHPISRAHLAAAATCAGSAALHGTLNHVLAGGAGSFAGHLAEVDRIGHSSGWDALAGATTALRARLRAERRPVSECPAPAHAVHR